MKDDIKINYGDDGTQCTLSTTGTCSLFPYLLKNCQCTVTCNYNPTSGVKTVIQPLMKPDAKGNVMTQAYCSTSGQPAGPAANQGPNCFNITLNNTIQSTSSPIDMFCLYPDNWYTPEFTFTINYTLKSSQFLSLNSPNLRCINFDKDERNAKKLVISYDSASCLSDKDCSKEFTLDMNLLPNNLSNISYLSVTSGTSDPIDPNCTLPSSKSVEYYEYLKASDTPRAIDTLIFSSGAIPATPYNFTTYFPKLTTLDLTRSTGTGSDGFDSCSLPPTLTAITLPDIPSIDYALTSVPANAKITLSKSTTTFNPKTFTADVITQYIKIIAASLKQITTLDLTAAKSTSTASTTLTTLDGLDLSVLTSLNTLLLPPTLTNFNPTGLPTTLTSLTMPKSVTSFSIPSTNGIIDLTTTNSAALTLDLSSATALTSLSFPDEIESFKPQGLPPSLTTLSISSNVRSFTIPSSNNITNLTIKDGVVFLLDISTATKLKTLVLPDSLSNFEPSLPKSLKNLCLSNTKITDFSVNLSTSGVTTLKLPSTLTSLNLQSKLPNPINVFLCSAPSLTDIKVDNGSGKTWELFTNDSSLGTNFTGWLINNCPTSLCSPNSNICSTPGQQSLCTAIKSIQSKSSEASGFKDTISKLYTSASSAKNADSLKTLINVFSDFLTLYTDCSSSVTFKCSDFCSSINWGSGGTCAQTPPQLINDHTLSWLLQQVPTPKTMPGFTEWDTLYEPNMQQMLFSTSSKLGTAFATALTTLGTKEKPAPNPFLTNGTANYVCTGIKGIDPTTGQAIGQVTFNFENNFVTVNKAIQTIIDNDKMK